MTMKTERGFSYYYKDDELYIVESSLAFEGAHVRIYGGRGSKDTDHVQLSVSQAKKVIAALQQFIAEAEADELTEPAQAEQ